MTESEEAVKGFPMTPPSSQGIMDSIAKDKSSTSAATESHSGSTDSKQTKSNNLDSATPDSKIDKGIKETQTHRDELRKENDDLKAQILQLSRKIQEVEKLSRKLTTKEDQQQTKENWEVEYEFNQWEAEHDARESEMRFRTHGPRTLREPELGLLNLQMERRMRQNQFEESVASSVQLESWDGSDNFSQRERVTVSPSSQRGLDRVPWAKFQEYIGGSQFAIDVLVGPALVSDSIAEIQRKGGGEVPAATGQRKSVASAKPGQAPLPERIRINSKAILTVLSKFHGKAISSDLSPVLMMQPFRALVFYKDEIREEKTKLESELEGKNQTTLRSETEHIMDHVDDKADVTDADLKSNNNDNKSENRNDEANTGKDSEAKSDIKSSIDRKKTLDDLNCLIEIIDSLDDKITYLASNECQRVTFNDIWYLFKPGDLVLSKDEKQAYRVLDVKFSIHKMKLPSARDIWMFDSKSKLEDSPIIIQCVYIDFDGEQIGPVIQTFSICRFDGEKNIRSLDILPFHRATKSDLEKALIKRGSTFIEACDVQRRGVPWHYSGITLETREEVDSQVVIDFEEAFAAENIRRDRDRYSADRPMKWRPDIAIIERPENPNALKKERRPFANMGDSDSEAPFGQKNKCIPECCSTENVHDDTYVERNRNDNFINSQFLKHGTSNEALPSLLIASRSLEEVMEDKNSITENERLVINYRVFGFIMRSRKWAKLDLASLGPTRRENTFDLLVLPPGHRRMVESLVTQHFLDRETASDEIDEVDIVRGKGKGLILLLHGAPGVGKTTTAGDLGSRADVVESHLETNFALASRWGCILLIDEADVFLEARQTENFERNSLVAVFLRALEYYTGILFLTTNRVGTFDEAFTSRVHISLYYPPLSQAPTLAVFKVNLTRIKDRFEKKKERGEADLEIDELSINEFILNYYAQNMEARWNGRQIRNACQTALALAEFEAQKRANPGVIGGRRIIEATGSTKKMINVQMTAKHFVDVAKAYLAFMRYLKEVHGGSAAQQAKNYRLRHDRYGLGEPASLLASRQRPLAREAVPNTWSRSEFIGSGTRSRPQGQQGWAKTSWQAHKEEYKEVDEDIGEYMYDEEDIYGQDNKEGLIQDEKDEEQFEDGSRYGQEYEYPEENEYDDVDSGPFEDEQADETYAEREGNNQFSEDNEQNNLAPPTALPRPAPSRAGHQGQHAGRATMNAPARGLRRGRGASAGISIRTPPGPLEQVPKGRGSNPPPGRGRPQTGTASGGRGRGRRVTPQQRG
ncbi:hypothetical protein F4777DRAFT_582133 [Nemania sp. FL0916]|nr:hypothetical protein F4777DRAFT_582133 [Nemania sp. FL0916]